ncbi:hypothetical protein [Microbacterium flavum]|uniref:Uncharacterized protein n=1 Tax=Microbacterium flavum TaxID=415216 RepID=A0ABS5XWD1_9MICO|nr:hypothetical protein [Microbacterium flavum]MBT8798845.1 hypothetical protein [Microbacterium flavum]
MGEHTRGDEPRKRRRRRPAVLAGGAAVAAIVVIALTTGAITSGGHGPVGPPAATGSARLVEVIGTEAIRQDGAVIATPCFAYRLPDVGAAWELVEGSRGCASSVVPAGGDALSQFHVRGMLRPADPAAALEEAVRDARDGGEHVDSAELVEIEGRTVARLTLSTRDGLRIATYLVPIAPVAAHEGTAVALVDIGSVVGEWSDGVVAHIIGSLPDAGAPPPAGVGGGS